MSTVNIPTVYIIDDDEAVRESLALLLDSVDLRHASYASAEEFLAHYSPEMTGCIVLDVRMPLVNGLELQAILNEKNNHLPILFVTGHGDVPMAVEAMQHGAIDFIQKPYRDEDLLTKIHVGLSLDAEFRQSLSQFDEIKKRLADLTPREHQVMEMMIEGHANKVIAIDLGISQRTVEIHRSNMMEKMGVKRLADLVRICLQARVV